MSQGQGLIYFLRGGDAVKIGFTRNLTKRLATLRTASAIPLRLIGCIHGTREDERELHQRCAELRVRGEWFRADADLLTFVDWLVAGDQVEARDDLRTLHLLGVLADTIYALGMLRPSKDWRGWTEDAERLFDEIDDRLRDAFGRVNEALGASEGRWEERGRVGGRLATYGPSGKPPRPTWGEVLEHRKRKMEAAKARAEERKARQAARDAVPAEYLSLRAIFAEEFPPDDHFEAARERLRIWSAA